MDLHSSHRLAQGPLPRWMEVMGSKHHFRTVQVAILTHRYRDTGRDFFHSVAREAAGQKRWVRGNRRKPTYLSVTGLSSTLCHPSSPPACCPPTIPLQSPTHSATVRPRGCPPGECLRVHSLPCSRSAQANSMAHVKEQIRAPEKIQPLYFLDLKMHLGFRREK